MPVDQFEDDFENFDIEDFDEEFEEDFEEAVEGEYQITNNEYQDFDSVENIPVVEFTGEKADKNKKAKEETPTEDKGKDKEKKDK